MAYGLPIVATEAGAIPEVVPQSSGILVPVDDAAALADALGRVMRDADLRGRLAAGARDTARRSPSWRDSAALIASAISLIGPR
jgi:glycosyltransferase involved in cell wall biosynthesis